MDVRACVWSYICMHMILFFLAFKFRRHIFLYFTVSLYKNEHLNTNFVSRLFFCCFALIISLRWIAVFSISIYANIYSLKSALDSFNMALDFAFLFRLLHTRVPAEKSENLEPEGKGEHTPKKNMIEVRITKIVCVFYASDLDQFNKIRWLSSKCWTFVWLFVRSFTRTVVQRILRFDSVAVVRCFPRLFVHRMAF